MENSDFEELLNVVDHQSANHDIGENRKGKETPQIPAEENEKREKKKRKEKIKLDKELEMGT